MSPRKKDTDGLPTRADYGKVILAKIEPGPVVKMGPTVLYYNDRPVTSVSRARRQQAKKLKGR